MSAAADRVSAAARWPRSNQERLGLLFAGLCATNGAVLPAIAKLTTGRADALGVAAVTISIAAVAAVAVLLAGGRGAALLDRKTWVPLALAGAVGTAAANGFFYLGASRASAIDTVLCLQIEPAYSLVLAWLFLGHRPSVARQLATLMILFGIGLAVGAPGFSGSRGAWWLLATPLCWQLSHLIVLRRLVGIDPVVLTAGRYVHGAWMLLLLWALSGEASMPFEFAPSLLAMLLLQGVVMSYLGTLAWYQALIRLDLARATAIVVPSIPLLSLVSSFLILGEVPSLRQAIGLVITAGGVLAFVAGVRLRERPLAQASSLQSAELPGDG